MVVAYALGFDLLPCAPGTAPEYTRSSASLLVFACERGEVAHAYRVRLALARGLLLRAGVLHGMADCEALARLLGADT